VRDAQAGYWAESGSSEATHEEGHQDAGHQHDERKRAPAEIMSVSSGRETGSGFGSARCEDTS
jgi:hypothetical protein